VRVDDVVGANHVQPYERMRASRSHTCSGMRPKATRLDAVNDTGREGPRVLLGRFVVAVLFVIPIGVLLFHVLIIRGKLHTFVGFFRGLRWLTEGKT